MFTEINSTSVYNELSIQQLPGTRRRAGQQSQAHVFRTDCLFVHRFPFPIPGFSFAGNARHPPLAPAEWVRNDRKEDGGFMNPSIILLLCLLAARAAVPLGQVQLISEKGLPAEEQKNEQEGKT